ncbi:hypothetical protein BX616_006662 [Lobosporangium transversale]|nr:hypothetical protein BX616_006662 [Lobosporangium transversale]
MLPDKTHSSPAISAVDIVAAVAGTGVDIGTGTEAGSKAEESFVTILETIDPTTIIYLSKDLEDPIPEISQPHTRQVLEQAAQFLREGQVVGMPTETVYGLAANALDSVAAQRIFKAKNRPQDNPLIVHVSSLKMLRSILKNNEIPAVYSDLIQTYWPGPLTLLFPRSNLIPNEITCGQATVAVRFPSHPITRALITICDRPLAAPSANSSGKPSPTLASHVMDDLQTKIPMVIDGGQCSFGIESTVVDGLRVPPAILRPGGVTFEQIKQVSKMEGVQVYKKHFTDVAMEQAPTTPGMKYRHYSPEAEVVLVEYIRPSSLPLGQIKDTEMNGSRSNRVSDTTHQPSLSSSSPHSSLHFSSQSSPISSLPPLSSSSLESTTGQYNLIMKEIERLKQHGKKRFGILRTSFTVPLPSPPTTTAMKAGMLIRKDKEDQQSHGLETKRSTSENEATIIEFPLGQGSKPEDVARELFRGLRYLDDQHVDCIFVEGISEEDEGLAVMNRLRKAASRTISAESLE